MDEKSEVTSLLLALRSGDSGAKAKLASLVYGQLRVIARRLMTRERPGHTLQPTALVHEAYLKLIGQDKDWQNRAHFFAVAAQVMRQVLVDYARAHGALKRPDARQKIDLDKALPASDFRADKFLALDEALSRLSEWDPRQCQVVEMRFFGGLTEEEIANVLGISVRTVKRDWSMAKAWLYGEIGR